MNHRLKEHDYAGRGFYFITAATYPRRNLFSVISDCKTHLTPLGEIVRDEWLKLHGEQPLLDYPRLAPVVVHRRRPPEETPINYDNCHFNNDLAKEIAERETPLG